MSTSIDDVKEYDGKKERRVDGKPVVSADAHAAVLKHEAHDLNTRERLSAYFTIAAAAFGLISDGCQYHLHSALIAANRLHRPEQLDDHVQCKYLRDPDFPIYRRTLTSYLIPLGRLQEALSDRIHL
jgi:hypothetical protein